MSESPVTVARQAMATRFEVALFGGDPVALRAAAEEALDEVQRVETMLNWRNPASPIAHLNARAAAEPVRVNPELFALLRQCQAFGEVSHRAFDITVGPLMRAWGFHATDGRMGDPEAITAAREACGMQHLELDELKGAVRFARHGVRLDFGAVGKGYALDQAAGILRDAGITCALIHGGTSTVCAIGAPPGQSAWKIAVEYPPGDDASRQLPLLAVIELRDRALSVSAVWGRVFRVGKDTFGHVIDPRTGAPADRALLSVFIADSAAESDALSTALLVDGPAAIQHFERTRPAARTLVLGRAAAPAEFTVHSLGIPWQPRTVGASVVARTAEYP